jgi:hypothetical protein
MQLGEILDEKNSRLGVPVSGGGPV